jgi:DNA-binding SARP family transcriptional activator
MGYAKRCRADSEEDDYTKVDFGRGWRLLELRDDVTREQTSSPDERALLTDVFEDLPHGIAVTDRIGRVLVWNRALEDILDVDAEPLGQSCCELFGCGTANGPLGGCLTEQAIRAGDSPVEVLIQRPDAVPLWATVAPMRRNGSRLVFEVRHMPRHDELSPANGRALREPRVRLFTLGPTEVRTPEGPLEGDWLDQRAGELLKFLACERHRVVPAEEIAESVWRHARRNTVNTVRYFVHTLRSKLEPARPKHGRASLVLARHGGYTLDDDEVWIDADDFETHVGAGSSALAHGEREAAREHFERAVALYRGDFLEDEPYADWALLERERLRALVGKALSALSELRDDDPEVAAGYLERLAQMEPFDGEVQRELLSMWVRQGRRSRAARHYRAFQHRLYQEFGQQPAFTLAELASPPG